MSGLDLDAIRARKTALDAAWDHEFMAPDGPEKAIRSADDVPALLAECDRLKADRDHLLTLLENAAGGLRLALQPRGQAELAAARTILEQTEKQIAKYKGAGT